MTKNSISLAEIDLSDQGELIRGAEVRRELMNAYDMIDNLQFAINGLIGLVDHIAKRPDISPELKASLPTDPRVLDAKDLMQ